MKKLLGSVLAATLISGSAFASGLGTPAADLTSTTAAAELAVDGTGDFLIAPAFFAVGNF